MRGMLLVLCALVLAPSVFALGAYVDSAQETKFSVGQTKDLSFYLKGDGTTKNVRFFVESSPGFAQGYETYVQVPNYDTVKVVVPLTAIANGVYTLNWGFEEEGSGGMQMDLVTKSVLQVSVGAGGQVNTTNTTTTTNKTSSGSSSSTVRRKASGGGGGAAPPAQSPGVAINVPTKEVPKEPAGNDGSSGVDMQSVQPNTGIAQGIAGDPSYQMPADSEGRAADVPRQQSQDDVKTVSTFSTNAKVFAGALVFFGAIAAFVQFVVYKKMRNDAT